MNKKIIIVSFAICVLLGISACSGNTPTVATTTRKSVTTATTADEARGSTTRDTTTEKMQTVETEAAMKTESVAETQVKQAGTGEKPELVGAWKSSGGRVFQFTDDGKASAELFGFEGGPTGTYSLSSKQDDAGCYTLFGTHITGGSVEYKITVLNEDEIILEIMVESTFAPKKVSLTRQ